MADPYPLSPKLYRTLFSSIYNQTKKDAKIIKENFSRINNPICPKEVRCSSAKRRKYNLTQEYNKKMEEKPEKIHKRRIPVKKNIEINLTVIADEPRNRSVKMFRNVRKNQSSMSAPKIERYKKNMNGNYKNFYLDNFNSIKQNQIDLDIKRNVRIFFYICGLIKYSINIEINKEKKILLGVKLNIKK